MIPEILVLLQQVQRPVILSLISIAALVVFNFLIKSTIAGLLRSRKLKENQGRFVRKATKLTSLMLGILIIVSVWGIDVKNFWIFLTGIASIVAIGFVAVWSILSNIVAGILIMFSDIFRLDDQIEIAGENIKGSVVDLKLFFVVVKDSEGCMHHIPNNVFFQKSTKKLKSE